MVIVEAGCPVYSARRIGGGDPNQRRGDPPAGSSGARACGLRPSSGPGVLVWGRRNAGRQPARPLADQRPELPTQPNLSFDSVDRPLQKKGATSWRSPARGARSLLNSVW